MGSGVRFPSSTNLNQSCSKIGNALEFDSKDSRSESWRDYKNKIHILFGGFIFITYLCTLIKGNIMYIITKRKDFYDGVVGTMGIDKTIVYDRETIVIDDDKEFPKPFQGNKYYDPRYKNHFHNLSNNHCYPNMKYSETSPFIVGFCGKLYIGWKLYREVPNNIGGKDLITDITYDYEVVKQYIKLISWGTKLEDSMNYVKTYNPIEVFRTINSPIFIYDSDYDRKYIGKWMHRGNSRFIINPILKDYEFYTVIDSFTAFQEIQMFMGGVLGNKEKEITEVDDKYKITQHGFNKWSFRKESTK